MAERLSDHIVNEPAELDRPVGFQVIHANRLEDLRTLLVEVIRRFPLPPLEEEVFLVHSNGIAQWLKLALARDEDDPDQPGLGIAAAMRFSLPSRFLWQVYRAVLGTEAVATRSPYDKDEMTWRLYRMLPELNGDPLFAPLSRFMAGAEAERRRYQLAERIADLFDQYQVYRADWLAQWQRGRNVMLVRGGQEKDLPPDQRWQAALWRRLERDIEAQGGRDAGASRAEIHARFLAAAGQLRATNRPRGVPRRLIVFGVSSLPQQTLEVLSQLGQCCQVLLCIHNPSQYYWADIVENRDLLRAVNRRGAQREGMPAVLDDHNLHLHAQPLLAAWGKQGRDYIRMLDEYDHQADYRHWFTQIDLFSSPLDGVPEAQQTLLMVLQDDILNLRPNREAIRPLIQPNASDRSLVFHTGHSAQREVEILQDQLLEAFSADPDLRPQDILVMVPDINQYAPHIEAVFGQLDPEDDRFIPFTISDQGERHQVPALIALEKLLSLPESRIAVSDVLDLLDVPAVRARFGLVEEDLPLLHQWIHGANIRWGLDGQQRASLALPEGMDQHTWSFGLRRMLLGYAVGDGQAWQGIEPFGEVGGLESRLAGQLELLLSQLERLWLTLSEPHAPGAWAQVINELREQFFGPLDEQDSLVFARLDQTVEQWLQACDGAGLDTTELPLAIVREVWLSSLDQSGLSQRFLAGKVNFATLMPMRAIPFEHICLLGMNDGDYPRSQPPVDFDLMAEDYRPGDRSRREDDRYLFLEALLSARKQLYISWIGRSINDNSERPPSVLVAQLRDHLDAIRPLAETARDHRSVSQWLTTEHPLQPFSPAYFGDSCTRGGLFTYAREWRQAHAEAAGSADGVIPTFSELPEDLLAEPINLATLGRFLRSPVDGFFQSRLGVYFDQPDAGTEDDEPFVLDGLSHWKLSDQLIQGVIARSASASGPGPEQAFEAALNEAIDLEIRRQATRGDFPSGGVGLVLQQRLKADLPALYQRYRSWLARFPGELDLQAYECRAQIDGLTVAVEDWLGPFKVAPEGGWALIRLSSSGLTDNRNRYRWHHFLNPWVTHLAASQRADIPVVTCLLSKAGDVTLPPLARERADELMTDLLTAWLTSLRTPLPLAPKTAFAWIAGNAKSEEKGLADARAVYEGGFKQSGEMDQSPALRRAFPSFDALVAGGGFQQWSERLYRPLWQAVKEAAR
ncbi:exodeoxyribonuclease V subunit gamma [Marinobacter sp. SS21]|uniref:exodeoxyribonuclease V subunit gamma n=1 Tax=Marinobacter sp. SS21 TaxID=2979460 RepID=UPI00232EA534|nr:exodeoxyribonuclease V subunit gamma [Marinobacter sp. SS21]MDC0663373.1 exodeoxyribonuclease V subunit gamma [Marinobacter sp. SS21]